MTIVTAVDANQNEIEHEATVSIIIPCYNDEAFVGEAIESALGQTHAPAEVIVIDDGSTDGSLDIIRSFGDRVTWHRQENQGAPAARNHGLRKATSRYVKFLDADDVLVADALQHQVAQIQALGEPEDSIGVHDAVFGMGRYIGEHGEVQEEETYRRPKEGENPIAYILRVNPQTSLPLHRREMLQRVGGSEVCGLTRKM